MIPNTKFKIRYNTPEGKTKWFDCVQISKGSKPKNSNEMYLCNDTIKQLISLKNLIISKEINYMTYLHINCKPCENSFIYTTKNV
jgi:hypothetical protein